MRYDLKEKKALITGATKGIGRAIASTFAQNGAAVSLCARNNDEVKETARYLNKFDVRVHAETVDVANADALRAWVHSSAEALDGIDVVVANPSAFGVSNSEQDWINGFNVDVMGSVRLIQAALPHLEVAARKSGDAVILLLSSVLAAATDTDSAYGAMKAALTQYGKGLARQHAAQGIRVNTISPGTIFSENGFWGNVQRHMPNMYETFLARNPLGRMGSPQEVAHVAAFLASSVSGFTTGMNFVIDGAFTEGVHF